MSSAMFYATGEASREHKVISGIIRPVKNRWYSLKKLKGMT